MHTIGRSGFIDKGPHVDDASVSVHRATRRSWAECAKKHVGGADGDRFGVEALPMQRSLLLPLTILVALTGCRSPDKGTDTGGASDGDPANTDADSDG